MGTREPDYCLGFDGFSVEFDLAVKPSLTETRAFDVPNPDFVFAVASIWLRTGNGRHLVSSEFQTGNLVERLRSLAKALSDPPALTEIAKIVGRGGVSAWMHGYWDRLARECSLPTDEAIYDLLFPLCLVAEDEGRLVIYEYQGTPTIEVAAKTEPGTAPITVFSEFDRDTAAAEVNRLRASITNAIQRRLVAH